MSAAVFAAIIGDGHVLPAANQFSLSGTQKSGSQCVAIACVSVITISLSVLKFRLFFVRYSINISAALCSGIWLVLLPLLKLIS